MKAQSIRLILSASLVVVFVALDMSATFAQSSVWEIGTGENKIFVGASIPISPTDLPLPMEFSKAFDESDALYLETDYDSMESLEIAARVLEATTYTGDTTLRSILSGDVFGRLEDHLASLGVPIVQVERLKPSMLVGMIQIQSAIALGYTTAVDQFLNERANVVGKRKEIIESLDAGIELAASLGEGIENEFVNYYLNTYDDIQETLERSLEFWLVGDEESMAELTLQPMIELAPNLYSRSAERVAGWIPTIEDLIMDDGVEFLVIYAENIVGEEGLLNLLRGRGYRVTQL